MTSENIPTVAGSNVCPPASEQELAELRRLVPGVPSRYVGFLRLSNGWTGTCSGHPENCRLWPCDLLISMNQVPPMIDYGIFGESIIIGTDLGPSILVVHIADGDDPPVYLYDDIIPSHEYRTLVAPSISDLISRMGKVND